MTEEEKKKQSGTVEYVPTYGQFAAAQNAGNAASNIASGIMPVTYAQGGAYTPTAATPAAETYSAGATGGAGTTPTTPTTTYADNVDGLTVRQMIERQRQASYADAEKLRERSVIDASTAYAQNKATYGANAEALAGMGLTGGGYGDYLNSRAYAQQREEIQAARAGEAAAKREADRIYYADMMAQTEKEDAAAKAEADKQDSAYATLLDAAKSGAYTADEIKALAGKMGITNEADLTALGNAATGAQGDIESEKQKAESDRQSAAYIELLGEAKTGAFTADEIRSMAGALGITDETKLTNLATAASAAQTAISEKEAASEADKKNAAYIELLAEAKKGTFTADEIKNMAGALGITDQTKLTELGNAATTAQSNIQSEKDAAAADKKNAAYATLLDAAKGGAYTADEIKALAGKMGITDTTDLTALGEAASTAYNAEDTKNKNSSYLSLLDAAKGGNYTEEVIRDLAKRMGLSDEDAEKLANAAKTTREANERENIGGNISADTTDEEISNMIISGELSETNRAEAEKARTEEAADAISEAVDSKDYETADKLVEKYYQSGAYDTDERQNYYMEKTLNFIDESSNLTRDIASLASDIVKLKNDGKISNEDYRKAMQYLSERATSALISGEDTQLKYSSGGRFQITINGKTYDGGYAVEPSEDAGGNIQNILDNAMGGYPKEGSIALYDDGVYVYAKLNGKGKAAWYKASRNFFVSGGNASGNKKIYEALQDIAMHRPTPTRPEHKAAK